MGCGSSRVKFVMNPDVPGQDEVAVEMFELLKIQQNEVDMLFRIFKDIDLHSTGSIQPIELFAYINMELGNFEKSIFEVLDADRSGRMNFVEFVCGMWNLLTVPEHHLGAYAYLMRDPSGKMRIVYATVKEVFEMINRKKMDANPATQAIFTELKEKYPSELSITDICKWTAINSSLLSPILILQIKLRQNIIGEKYWQHQTDLRAADPEKNDIGYIKQLMGLVKSKIEKSKVQKVAQKEKQAKEAKIGNRDNIARKQSVLLEAFNMKKKPSSNKRVASAGAMATMEEEPSSPSSPASRSAKKSYSREFDNIKPKPTRDPSSRNSLKSAGSKKLDSDPSLHPEGSMKKSKSKKSAKL